MQFRFRDPVMSVNVGVIKLCRLEKDKLLIVKKNGYPEFEDVRQGCKKLCKNPHIFSENCIFSGVDETIPCLHIHQRASASDTLRE